MIVSILTSFLLISRTLYNLLAITIVDLKLPDFGFDWINVTDQVLDKSRLFHLISNSKRNNVKTL